MSHIPKTNFTVMGVDPDTFNTGIAVVSGRVPLRGRELENVRVERVHAASAKGRQIRSRLVDMLDAILAGMESLLVPDPDLVVVEGQAFRPNDPRPDDIVQLAVVQGIAAGIGWTISSEVMMPLPVSWKGTVDKVEHQRRVLRDLGLAEDLDEVPGAATLNKTSRRQVVDGIGLAVWGLEQLAHRERRARILR